MTPVGFVLVCAGLGIIIVAAALAVRILRPPTSARPSAQAPGEPDPGSDVAVGLQLRLRELNTATFGAPLRAEGRTVHPGRPRLRTAQSNPGKESDRHGAS